MKKIALLIIASGLLAACSTGQQKNTNNNCRIEGNDCWKIVQLLEKTKEVSLNTTVEKGENVWENPVKYENPDLASLGLEVSQCTTYRDGGSTVYILNDNVAIFTNRRLGKNPQYGYTTVTFKENTSKFVFDQKGNLK